MFSIVASLYKYFCVQKKLLSIAGYHFTGPSALRRCLSAGLPFSVKFNTAFSTVHFYYTTVIFIFLHFSTLFSVFFYRFKKPLL